MRVFHKRTFLWNYIKTQLTFEWALQSATLSLFYCFFCEVGKGYVVLRGSSVILSRSLLRWLDCYNAPGEVGDDGDQLVRANWLRHMCLEA